jgi:hypothetical protein
MPDGTKQYVAKPRYRVTAYRRSDGLTLMKLANVKHPVRKMKQLLPAGVSIPGDPTSETHSIEAVIAFLAEHGIDVWVEKEHLAPLA